MTAVVAVCENGGIGKDGTLLFHIREDLRRFRQLTLGKTVVMGRKTLESLPGGRGLPDRRNLVVSTTMAPREGPGAFCSGGGGAPAPGGRAGGRGGHRR